jgi:hypothetical protein
MSNFRRLGGTGTTNALGTRNGGTPIFNQTGARLIRTILAYVRPDPVPWSYGLAIVCYTIHTDTGSAMARIHCRRVCNRDLPQLGDGCRHWHRQSIIDYNFIMAQSRRGAKGLEGIGDGLMWASSVPRLISGRRLSIHLGLGLHSPVQAC